MESNPQKCIKHIKNDTLLYICEISDFASLLYTNNSLYVLKLTQKDDNLKKNKQQKKTTPLILDEK